jgi:hypothetical protein
VAEALEQCLRAVVEVLSKLRQGTLGHFVDRQFTGEISADSHELDQGLHFSNFIWIQHRIWPDLSRWSWPQQSPHAAGH